MMDKSCCDEQGHDCLQSRDCPIYQQRRRVRAGQPAPPILIDPVDIDDKNDELPAWLSALIVYMLMAVVGLMAFAWVVAL
jgi:hypothetical protein